jgi:hypothetical protein
MSLERLADVLKYSKSALARFETAEAMIPPDLPAKLDMAFDADRFFEKLYTVARRESHPDGFRRRMEIEAQAELIQEFSGQIVPGLLQTETYARHLFRAFDPKISTEREGELLAGRLGRQEILHRLNPPNISIIIDEIVLHRLFGSQAAKREQLERLIAVANTPTCSLQVVPNSLGGYSIMGGSLTAFTLSNGSRFVWEEGITVGSFIDDPETIRSRMWAYDRLRASALSPDDSVKLIRSVMEALTE